MTEKWVSLHAPPGFRDSLVRVLPKGQVFAGTFTIGDEIARVEDGVVYEGHDVALVRPIALKLGWRDPGAPSLLPDARRCAAVRDPSAVAVYAIGKHEGAEYVVAERVTGTLLAEHLREPLPAEQFLARYRTLVAAVARAHEAGIAIGDISSQTVLVDPTGRLVLGRLSLSQVPAFGPHGPALAPEVASGVARADDPAAAEAIDLYGLGLIALELAQVPPGADDLRPPRLADLRSDLPGELSDLVEWLLDPDPANRPPSAAEALAEVETIVERAGTRARSIRVLIVDDDTARGRWLWSLVRRAHPATIVEVASEGTDAAHKLNRDLPDLVFVDAHLRGVMNALELCMYARGLEQDPERPGALAHLVLIGDAGERERLLFADASVPFLPDDASLAAAVLDRVRRIAAEAPRRLKKITTVSG